MHILLNMLLYIPQHKECNKYLNKTYHIFLGKSVGKWTCKNLHSLPYTLLYKYQYNLWNIHLHSLIGT